MSTLVRYECELCGLEINQNAGGIKKHQKSDRCKELQRQKKEKSTNHSIVAMWSKKENKQIKKKRNYVHFSDDNKNERDEKEEKVSPPTKKKRTDNRKQLKQDNEEQLEQGNEQHNEAQLEWCEGFIPRCLEEYRSKNIATFIPDQAYSKIFVMDNVLHAKHCEKLLLDPHAEKRTLNKVCYGLSIDRTLSQNIQNGFIVDDDIDKIRNTQLCDYGKKQKLEIYRKKIVRLRSQIQNQTRKQLNNSVRISIFERIHAMISTDTSNIGRFVLITCE